MILYIVLIFALFQDHRTSNGFDILSAIDLIH